MSKKIRAVQLEILKEFVTEAFTLSPGEVIWAEARFAEQLVISRHARRREPKPPDPIEC